MTPAACVTVIIKLILWQRRSPSRARNPSLEIAKASVHAGPRLSLNTIRPMLIAKLCSLRCSANMGNNIAGEIAKMLFHGAKRHGAILRQARTRTEELAQVLQAFLHRNGLRVFALLHVNACG